MEAKDKAIDLKAKFLEIIPNNIIQDDKAAAELARVNAIICVDELTKENLTMDNESISDVEMVERLNQRYSFWKEVKSELEKMKV